MSFIQAQVTTDAGDLTDAGVDAINTTLSTNDLPNWSAADATLAVIVLSIVAQLLSNVAQVSATMLPALFRAFGTQLFGVPYQNGVQASVASLWTFTSPAPDSTSYTIDQGTALLIDGQTFYTQSDYTAAAGDVTAPITLVANTAGSAYNNLGGVDQPISLNEGIDWVQTVVTLGVTSDGRDPQTDTDYQNTLQAALTLQAPRPVVDADFATFVQTDIAEQVTGVTVGRAVSLDGYYPDGRALSTGGTNTPTVLTCQLTSGSPTVYYSGSPSSAPEIGATVTGTGVPAGATVAAYPPPNDTQFTLSVNATATGAESLTVTAMTGYGPPHLTCVGDLTSGSPNATIVAGPFLGSIPDAGARVAGPGVPNGTTVLASPAPTATSFKLSQNASSAETNATLAISSWTSVQLAECTIVADDNGNPLTAVEMDTELAFLETYRPTGYLLSVIGGNYTPIYATVVLSVLPGYVPSVVAAASQSALMSWLSPLGWGNFAYTTGNWVNQNKVFYNRAIAVATVSGVNEVVSLAIGTTASPSGTSDLTLLGPAPLPTSTVESILVSTV